LPKNCDWEPNTFIKNRIGYYFKKREVTKSTHRHGTGTETSGDLTIWDSANENPTPSCPFRIKQTKLPRNNESEVNTFFVDDNHLVAPNDTGLTIKIKKNRRFYRRRGSISPPR